MDDLTRRIERTVLSRFGDDKRQALRYLQTKCTFYARKADSKRGTRYHAPWRAIYLAYSSAAFRIGYWLSLDEEFWDDDLTINECDL